MRVSWSNSPYVDVVRSPPRGHSDASHASSIGDGSIVAGVDLQHPSYQRSSANPESSIKSECEGCGSQRIKLALLPRLGYDSTMLSRRKMDVGTTEAYSWDGIVLLAVACNTCLMAS